MRIVLKYLLLTIAVLSSLHYYAQEAEDAGPATASISNSNKADGEWIATCKALIEKGHINRADSLFQTITFKKGDDSSVSQLQKRLEMLKRLEARGADGKLVPLNSINSKYDDFAPLQLKEEVFFSSFRPAKQSRSYRGKPTAKIYCAKNAHEPGSANVGLYNPSIQDPWHNSNLCQMGDTVFFNRSTRKAFWKDSDGISELQIYMAVDSKSGDRAVLAPFNEIGFHYAHPFADTLRKRVYFSSNRPGGFGGMDIWYVEKQGDKWSSPKNAGKGVNTGANEVFPTSFADRLYFASNGHLGYGGYDVFTAQIPPSEVSKAENVGPPVNSPHDDLSPVFTAPDSALVVSNRPGGKGGDDIYRWVRSYPSELFRRLQGRLQKGDENIAGQSLIVKNDDGLLIGRAKTDSAGKFTLDNIRGEEKYSVELDGETPTDTALYSLELFNDKGETVKRIMMDANGKFVFTLLSPDDFDNLETIPNRDESLLEIDIRGEIFSSKPGDIDEPGYIYLLSVRKDTLAKVKWNEKGQFTINNLSPEDKYIIRPGVQKEELVVRLINEKGELMETLLRISDRDFLYERLSPEDRYILLQNENDNPIKIRLDEFFDVPNIYYRLDEADILPQSAKQLDKLVKLLKNNPHVGIALTAHTDSRGSDNYNLRLSRDRVENTIEYLRKKGIGKDRLKGTGKGEAELVNDCRDGVDCTEEEHARNRRTEFSVFSLE